MAGPVTVDVTTDTASRWRGLAVLAPQTIAGLRVRETIRVDNGEDVEVVCVFKCGGRGIRRGEKLVRRVFDDLMNESDQAL